jgi:Ca2+/Na+ antiporter
MPILIELIKFLLYSFAIVVIAKYLLVPTLRKLSELLNLGPKASGNIAGIATSVPELLTVSFAAYAGFIDTGIYNVLSSNVINLIQYLCAIYLNKNQKYIRNKAIRIDIIMVIITIIIPAIIVVADIELNMFAVIIFIIMLGLFYYINLNAHKLYLRLQDEQIEKEENSKYEQEEKLLEKGSKKIIQVIINIIYIILIAIALYVIGNLLSDNLTSLSTRFNLPEIILGIALGVITSIPELITFTEAQRKADNQNVGAELGVVEATNNLLTSNLLNLFAIQSIGIIIFNLFGK